MSKQPHEAEAWSTPVVCNCGGRLTELSVNTHKPEKWRLIDIETEQVWKHADNGLILVRDIIWYRKASPHQAG